jgi:hypothetical protein
VKDKPCINSVIWTIQFSFFVFNQYTRIEITILSIFPFSIMCWWMSSNEMPHIEIISSPLYLLLFSLLSQRNFASLWHNSHKLQIRYGTSLSIRVVNAACSIWPSSRSHNGGNIVQLSSLYMFVYFKITPKPLVLGVFCLIDINCIFLEVISSSFFWIVLILFFCYSLKWYWIGTTWWGWNWTPKSL